MFSEVHLFNLNKYTFLVCWAKLCWFMELDKNFREVHKFED